MPSRQEEDPLIAVILPDDYEKAESDLLPILDLSIDSATRAGASEIYILSGHDIQREGIKLIKTEATSEGDAMRDLDSAQVIRSDFLLFRRSVCTFDLARAVEEHKRRRKLDKDVIMTSCCMPARFASDHPIFFIDPTSNQIMHYDSFKKVTLPSDLLKMDLDIRSDLVESVEICSIDVPPLFTENFDYQTFSDFASGIITSDLLTSKIFLKICDGYGSHRFSRRWIHSQFASDQFDGYTSDTFISEEETSDEDSVSSIGSESESEVDEDDFGEEARASLERALEEGHRVEDAALELKTLRMASNVPLEEVREVVLEVLLGKSSDPKQVLALMARWAKLIALVSNDEADAICQIQSYCADHSTHSNLFIPLLKMFYNDDIFQDDSFIDWWRSEGSQTEANSILREKAQGIIRHILEADSDDDDD